MRKRFHFCACPGEYLLKDAEQNFQKKPVITLVLGPGHLNLTLAEISTSNFMLFVS